MSFPPPPSQYFGGPPTSHGGQPSMKMQGPPVQNGALPSFGSQFGAPSDATSLKQQQQPSFAAFNSQLSPGPTLNGAPSSGPQQSSGPNFNGIQGQPFGTQNSSSGPSQPRLPQFPMTGNSNGEHRNFNPASPNNGSFPPVPTSQYHSMQLQHNNNSSTQLQANTPRSRVQSPVSSSSSPVPTNPLQSSFPSAPSNFHNSEMQSRGGMGPGLPPQMQNPPMMPSPQMRPPFQPPQQPLGPPSFPSSPPNNLGPPQPPMPGPRPGAPAEQRSTGPPPPRPGVYPAHYPPMGPTQRNMGDSRRPNGPMPPTEDFSRMGIQAQEGKPVDLMQQRHILPPVDNLSAFSEVQLPGHSLENPKARCDPDIFRSTLPSVPSSPDLLKKSRLPLGIILHPFRDMKSLTILQVSVIVRCRACRTYINPYVQFTDHRHWRCNICFRVNDLPDDFSWDPVTKSYGEPSRRPEIKHSTIEFIAPGEYMLRPPQAALYIYVLDVSSNAIETGYLGAFCATLLKCVDRIPGDRRTMMAFITVDSGVHFYQFAEGSPQPKQLIVTELDDIFVPCSSGLLVNVSENKDMIREFIQSLPTVFEHNSDPHSAMGAAVSAAHQLGSDIGARITVVQTILPDVGPGALKSREDPNLRASSEVDNLGPATDYYKTLALECSGHQVAIDLFLLSSQYADLATLSGMAKFSGGCIHHYPNVHILRNSLELTRFEKDLQRYFTRKIGFESVLRIRCTKGLSLHTFHGNFFVRSTDLLALPNTNPDTALGVQVQMDESLADLQTVSFQCALLYTSSKGDRRIRVHTLCLPVTNSLAQVQSNADVEAIVSLLAKLAVERSVGGSLADAREALINSVIDGLGSYMATLTGPQSPGPQSLVAPPGSLRLFPLFVLSLLKHVAFSHGTSVKLDRRFFAMSQFRTLPIRMLMLEIYPNLYPLHTIDQYETDEEVPRLQLSYERIDRHGLYLMDTGSYLYLYVGQAVSDNLARDLFNVPNFTKIDEDIPQLPEMDTGISERIRGFLVSRQSGRTFYAPLRIIREDSPMRELFVRRLIEDKSESTHSYIEFLQYLKKEIGPRR